METVRVAKSVGEDVTFYETVMDWVTTDGTPVHVGGSGQMARWKDHQRTVLSL